MQLHFYRGLKRNIAPPAKMSTRAGITVDEVYESLRTKKRVRSDICPSGMMEQDPFKTEILIPSGLKEVDRGFRNY
jgi:hypothetical protein